MCQITLNDTQTKTLCLILNEHEKLSIENPLLKQQISSLEELNQLNVKKDSLKNEEINIYKDKIASSENQIQQLKSIQKKTFIGMGGIILIILLLL